jgi:hypothetical protein
MRNCFFLIILTLAACSDAPSAPAHSFKAEQVVTLTENAWGCESYMQLGRAADHYNKGEYSAWAEELDPPLCFNGPEDPGEWTVYEVNGAAVRVGKATAQQYEAASKLSPPYDLMRQYWVPSKFVVAKGGAVNLGRT